MPVTSAAFDAANKVVFKTRIQHMNLNRGSAEQADFLDINQNGRADSYFQRTGLTTAADVYQEPALGVSFKRMADQAAALGQGEVLTQSDLNNIQINDVRVDWGTTVFTQTRVSHSNTRSLATLVAQLAPLGDKNGCAINTKTGEFLIYSPNA